MNVQRTSPSGAEAELAHAALLYRSPEHLGDVVADFATQAAQGGEPILALLPEGSYERVQNAIQDTGAETHFEDISERAANPSCLLEVFESWIDDHDGPVRVIDEPVWPGRSHAEVVEVLRHEALVNHVLADARASILCPYDTEHLEAHALEGAELTHPQLIRDGVARANDRYGDPLEMHAGTHWPQPPGSEPISRFDFSGDLHALREAVDSDLIAASLGRERRADLVFAVNEAATNAIKHGDGQLTARLWRDDDAVVSEVASSSPLPDVLAGRRRPDPGAGGGRGLWLINQLCDLVELRTGDSGTTLRMHVRATRT